MPTMDFIEIARDAVINKSHLVILYGDGSYILSDSQWYSIPNFTDDDFFRIFKSLNDIDDTVKTKYIIHLQPFTKDFVCFLSDDTDIDPVIINKNLVTGVYQHDEHPELSFVKAQYDNMKHVLPCVNYYPQDAVKLLTKNWKHFFSKRASPVTRPLVAKCIKNWKRIFSFFLIEQL